MKLPLKLNTGALKFFVTKFPDVNNCALIDWLKELSESYNLTINYIEELEERIKDLEKNELY